MSDTTQTQPDSATDAEVAESVDTGDNQRSREIRRLVAIAAVTIVLCGLASWCGVAAYNASTANAALIDTTSTTDVSNQVRDTVEKVFSYDHAKTADTENLAKQRLSGPALAQYDQLFAQVKRIAPQQNIVLTTKVASVGVISLQADQARVLVFADQKAQRAGTDQQNTGPAQLEVGAQRFGSIWKITDITLL